ncbi:Copper transport protein, putative [Candida maltosa Xu316]|uniref:Copper transport protein n=1 Tax=Candida maltosa (strain Xu316) TaxID=1245528 RepID=M3JTJ4_CANMX|nr:Copper transport protein, putative [Candida maltosa Xu316]
MDHSSHSNMQAAMSHGDMDHSMPGMEDRCSMNMIFTWDWKNTCIVFKWWHIKTQTGFVLSLLSIVLLGALYEFIKKWFSVWERKTMSELAASNALGSTQERNFKYKRGFVYGFQVLFSFWLMLVFMTYNGWYMLAVAVGAGLGNYLWGDSCESGSSRTMACH